MSEPPTSSTTETSLLSRIFRRIIRLRQWIIGFYAALLIPATYFATRIGQDNSLERLIVVKDRDYVTIRAFERVFGDSDYAIVLAEAEKPFSPAVLERMNGLEQALGRIPGVEVDSPLTLFRRTRGGFVANPETAAAFRAFTEGTDLFRRQGLVGEHHLATSLVLTAPTSAERRKALPRIDFAVAAARFGLTPDSDSISAIRVAGRIFVDAHLDEATRRGALHLFPVFGLFVVAMNLLLYRSARALIAFSAVLVVATLLTLGFIGAIRGTFTIVSSLVPMTVMIVCTANLVYVHSRFARRPAERSVDEHQLIALENKFLPCTVSIVASASGFAALMVSRIRPIREVGAWVAAGLFITWLVVFTLFPALQKTLRTPSKPERAVESEWFLRFTEALPGFTRRHRRSLVAGAILCCIAGAICLFGFPRLLSPMHQQTNIISYLDPHSPLRIDVQHIADRVPAVAPTEIWLSTERPGALGDVAVVRGLDDFQTLLEADPRVGTVAGPIKILQVMQYATGLGDHLSPDDRIVSGMLAALVERVPSDPTLQRYFDRSFSQTHFTVLTGTLDHRGFVALTRRIDECWRDARGRHPALDQFTLRTTGLVPLEAKIDYYLVPTLVQSFALTAAIIFCVFLIVFRSGTARLLAMIPSLFAILAMFAVMRVSGMGLNVATILVATTVLGTSENDQVHFFYHYQESREPSTEAGLVHTLRIAGRAIVCATLINAAGFLAFTLADLPPMRQFGMLTALAMVLSMVADFTALPAALWLIGSTPKGKSAT